MRQKLYPDHRSVGSLWWAQQGSNLRPTGYEPGALPLSYGPLKHNIILAYFVILDKDSYRLFLSRTNVVKDIDTVCYNCYNDIISY